MHLLSLFVLKIFHKSSFDGGPNEDFIPFSRDKNLCLIQNIVVNRVLSQNTSLNLIRFVRNWRKANRIRESVPLRRKREGRLKVIRLLIMRLSKLTTNRIRRRVLPN